MNFSYAGGLGEPGYVDHLNLEPRTTNNWSGFGKTSMTAVASLGLTKESFQPENVESVQHGAPKMTQMITEKHRDDVFILGSTVKTLIDGEVSCLSALRGEVEAAKFAKAAPDLTCQQQLNKDIM